MPNEIQSKVNLESKDELTNKTDRILIPEGGGSQTLPGILITDLISYNWKYGIETKKAKVANYCNLAKIVADFGSEYWDSLTETLGEWALLSHDKKIATSVKR